jgi:hypothetical protein
MDGTRQQVFAGWVFWFAFDRAGDLLVLEGKSDLKGVLWRVGAAEGARWWPTCRCCCATVN